MAPDAHGSHAVPLILGLLQGEVGQSKLLLFTSLEAAKKDFEKKFWEKTKNSWAARENFVAQPGKYTLIEVQPGAGQEVALRVSGIASVLSLRHRAGSAGWAVGWTRRQAWRSLLSTTDIIVALGMTQGQHKAGVCSHRRMVWVMGRSPSAACCLVPWMRPRRSWWPSSSAATCSATPCRP